VRLPPPAGLAAYGALVAAVALLVGLGVLPAWAGVVHLVALPPLDVFADLRLVLTTAPDYPTLALGLVASAGLRVLLVALLAGEHWRPAWRLAASVYAVAVVPALVAAQLNFVAHAALYSRVFWAAVVLTGVVVALLAAAVWTGAGRLAAGVRQAGRAGLRIWLVACYLAGVLVTGAVVSGAGAAAHALGVVVCGALTLAVIARLREPAGVRPALQLGSAAAVLVVASVSLVTTRGMAPADPAAERDGSLLVMSGINSASGQGAIFELDPAVLGYTCDQKYYYSYAGPGDGQPRGDAACPIRTGAPYEPEHTQRPFDEQVQLLGEQVAGLPAPVTLIAHSQAAWVAWQAASDGRLDRVETLVLLGPFPSSPVGYPPPGQAGPGRVGGDGFRLLEPLVEAADFDFMVDAPLSRELLAVPDAVSDVLDAPLPDGLRVLSVTAVPDLSLMPDGWRIEGSMDACPVREAHPYLPLTPAFHRVLNTVLDGDEPRPCPPWPDLVHRASQPLGVPSTTRG